MKLNIILGSVIAAASAAPSVQNGGRMEKAARKSPSGMAKYQSQMAGFQNPEILHSIGGHATCIQGNIPVQASAINTNLNYSAPASSLDLTNTILKYVQTGSDLLTEVLQGPSQVNGTYTINSRLCFPVSGEVNNSLPLQFLIHGVGFDKNYWDFYSSEYSYVDYMAKRGYTTFSFDRLGVGLSTRPDPLQVVQSALEVSIAHSLIQKLRSGSIASTTFTRIVGTGHSFGSIQINGITKAYPKDLDAAVLTGFSTNILGVGAFLTALNLDIANKNQHSSFSHLPNAYTLTSSQISSQLGYFRYPNFDPAVLAAVDRNKTTFALGELFTLGASSGVAAEFTGPVDMMAGEFDLPFCEGNCNYPSDQMTMASMALYPKASNGSRTFLAQNAGHAVNLHYGAAEAYKHIVEFLKANGL